MAAATTEPTVEALPGDELEVTVRLLDEGALVRWRREPSDESRCTLRWYEGAPPGERLLVALHTHHDYALGECVAAASVALQRSWLTAVSVAVGELEEGGQYWARVQCVSGFGGGAALRVPEYGRLRGVAGGVAAVALLLAAVAGALFLARRRFRARRTTPAATAPPAPFPRADKRLY